MAVRVSFDNPSQQLRVFARALPDDLQEEWGASSSKLIDMMGDELDDLIQVEVFDKKAAPDGTAWEQPSPLSRALASAEGRSINQGGDKLRQSFQIGSPGNFWEKRKWGFSLGSVLRGSGKGSSYYVARTFQTAFKIPRTAETQQIICKTKTANKLRKIERDRARRSAAEAGAKGARVRAYMGAMTGWHAPGIGKQLTHPARQITGWVPRWVAKMDAVIEQHLAVVIKRVRTKTEAKVKAAQRMLDARRNIAG